MKDLFKIGIVIFVLISAMAGYAIGFPVERNFEWSHFLLMLTGLFFLSSGSFALNQAQEAEIDAKMPRTAKRPIPSGKISLKNAIAIGVTHVAVGAILLNIVEPVTAILGLATVILYNGFYTMFWKRRWAFGAVPGAIPGAMPALLGYSAIHPDIFTADALYLFLLMFLWQMPHFWAIAIKFSDDYKEGGIPVLPVVLGSQRTLYHSALYSFVYVGLAVLSPFFLETGYFYLFMVLPISGMVLFEFFKFFKANGEQSWGRFFAWVNISMLAFLLAPVIDKWFLFLKGDVIF